MPKTKAQKGVVLQGLTDSLKASEFGVLTDFDGLTMVDLDNFRQKAYDQGVKYTVVKTTLMDLAAKEAGLAGVNVAKHGRSYALALGGKDEVALAKLIHELAKGSDGKVNIAAGIIHGEVVSADTIKQLALLPSQAELLARVVGSMNAPISNFVYSLNWNLQSFYNVVKAIQSKS